MSTAIAPILLFPGGRTKTPPPAPDRGVPELPRYSPTFYSDFAPLDARHPMAWVPKGLILHGTRSGRLQSRSMEFNGTRAYIRAGCGGQYLAWHLTVGEDEISEHLGLREWGYHARAFYSENYIGIEFAQPTADFEVTAAQVRAAAWWIRERLLVEYPGMPLDMMAHSEVEPGIRDGKTDVFPRGDDRNNGLRDRLRLAISGT